MKEKDKILITESPRDAQQGLPYVLLPEKRAEYINTLLKVGFDVLDFGSFVSPRAIPQMAEQAKVLEMVDKTGSKSRLMAIVGNMRGGTDAAAQPKLDIIGFPYSTSEAFLLKNINSDNTKALTIIDGLLDICEKGGKNLHIFLSMAFGNPYGDSEDISLLADRIGLLSDKGIRGITLADTIGVASPEKISEILGFLLPQFPGIKFGLHIHTRPGVWLAKIDAAWRAGCRSFDGVINGIGGCPMTGYELVGNLDTHNLVDWCKKQGIETGLETANLEDARNLAKKIFQ